MTGPSLLAQMSFAPLDWLALSAYLLIVGWIGLRLARRQKGDKDFFLAGRRIPMFAAAASLLATSLSAATFIGAPDQAFRTNLTYLSASIGGVIGAIIVARLFIPAFYKTGAPTIYAFLEERFGVLARRSASAMFMIGRVFASGARLYIASIPLSLMLFGDLDATHLTWCIIGIAIVACLYTMLGGVGAVIWTDLAQIIILVGAAGAGLIMLLRRIPASPGEIVDALTKTATSDGGSKLALIDMSLDPSAVYTLWTALIGFTLFNMAAFGADQDLAQRLLTCENPKKGGRSLIVSQFAGVVTTLLFMSLGLLLYVYYRMPEIMGDAAPERIVDDGRRVFAEFILTEAPAGLRGLMIAGLVAAAMSSLDSVLTALASTTVCDFYEPLRPGRSEREHVRASRIAIVVWALILGAFASVCIHWQQRSEQSLIDFSLGVMIYAYGGLLGVFLAALLTKRGSNASVLAALITGVVVTIVLREAESLGLNRPISMGWQMTLASAASFGVCILRRGSGGASGVERESTHAA